MRQLSIVPVTVMAMSALFADHCLFDIATLMLSFDVLPLNDPSGVACCHFTLLIYCSKNFLVIKYCTLFCQVNISNVELLCYFYKDYFNHISS